MIYCGCDPGKNGALAYITEDGAANVFKFDAGLYVYTLRRIAEQGTAVCCLEHVGAMPGQGVTSMFHFGENFGFIEGLLFAYGIRFELVRPQKWKKEFSVTADKNSSIAVCKRLFPSVSLKRTDRCAKDDDNLAEAILLAEYARRRL